MRKASVRITRGSSMPHPLTNVLQFYISQIDKSQADIARESWLDESYVSRLLRGERVGPSRDALILLAVYGLELAVHEVDEVLMAADYKPLVLASSLR